MRYLFEDYTLDTDRRELHREAEIVSVAPQVFDLLEYLIRNRERVVSKDDLISAIWNGRSVSDAALTTRLNVARDAIGDSGHEQRLIKTLPRKGFRFVGRIQEAHGSTAAQSALALPERPSVAVLPFENMSGDAKQDYFADGIVDEIITALSRFTSLFVIARNSSFTYKGRIVDIKQIGRELGVRYVVDGSVRKGAEKIRMTVQLIDATSGVHLWADRFEGNLGDVFALQDEITVKVVSAIQPKLLQTEIEFAVRRPNNLSAYDLYLRATSHHYAMTREGTVEALQLLSRALDIEPRYSAAASLAIFCRILNLIQGWTSSPQHEFQEVTRLAQLVLDIDENNPEALASVGWAKAYVTRDIGAATELVDRAVALNPNSAIAWIYRGMICQVARRHHEAIRSFEHAMRLNPLDPMVSGTLLGMALAFISLRRFDEAASAAEKALRKSPTFTSAHRCLAIALVHLGRNSEAKKVVARMLELEPDFRISEWVPRVRQWGVDESFADGLRKAGCPE